MPTQPYWALDEAGKKVRVPSVTSILKFIGGSAEGLIQWAWKTGYEGMTLDDARKRPMGIGTLVHAMVEADLHGSEVNLATVPPDMAEPAQKAFGGYLRWKGQKSEFSVLGSEVPLVSQKHMYGGTFDAATYDGRRKIVDLKVANGVYAEALVQVTAYAMLWNEHHPEAQIEDVEILRIAKGDGSFHHHSWSMDTMDDAWTMFRCARKLYDLHREIKGKL